MSKVYITQESGRINLIPATRFGEIEIVHNSDVPVYGDNEKFITMIEHRLCNFDPDNDYLVLVGDPVLIGICVAILAGRFLRFEVLKWDRQELLYVPITLTFREQN